MSRPTKLPDGFAASWMAGNSTQLAQVIPYSGQISFGYRYKSKRQVRKWCNRKLRRSVYASMMGNGPKWWHVSAPICRVCHKEHKGNYSTAILPKLGWKVAAPVACPTYGETVPQEGRGVPRVVYVIAIAIVLFAIIKL